MLLFDLDIGIRSLFFILNPKKTFTNKTKKMALEKYAETVSAHLLSLVTDFNNYQLTCRSIFVPSDIHI